MPRIKSTDIELLFKAKVLIPKIPTYLTLANGATIPIYTLGESDLRQIGEQWTRDLIAKAKTLKEEKK